MRGSGTPKSGQGLQFVEGGSERHLRSRGEPDDVSSEAHAGDDRSAGFTESASRRKLDELTVCGNEHLREGLGSVGRVREEVRAAVEALSDRIASGLSYEGIADQLVEEVPRSGSAQSDARIGAAEEARRGEAEPLAPGLPSLAEGVLGKDAPPQEILLGDLQPLQVRALVVREPDVDLGRPLVPGRDHDALAPAAIVLVRDRSLGEEAVLIQEPSGLRQ